VGIFSTNADHTFMTQLIGVVSYGAVAFPLAFLIFYILKITMGVRVSKEHETEGLDSHEHGIRGYTIIVE
ncbi:MAG: ammonium transporter, partial [Cyclobacteriaceae bacterium]|nr:ammonium transporter [Cyclobacteriaceae bacterium]